MKIREKILVPLGYGKYVRSDIILAIEPIEQDRGPGRRTKVYVANDTEPIIASRSEEAIVRDLVQEPSEITELRQQQEILRDILEDIADMDHTLRKIVKDQSKLDIDLLEKRVKEALT